MKPLGVTAYPLAREGGISLPTGKGVTAHPLGRGGITLTYIIIALVDESF